MVLSFRVAANELKKSWENSFILHHRIFIALFSVFLSNTKNQNCYILGTCFNDEDIMMPQTTDVIKNNTRHWQYISVFWNFSREEK